MAPNQRRGRMRIAALLAGLIVGSAATPPLAGAPPCPPELLDAARAHGAFLSAVQERVPSSSEAAPAGIEQVQQYDRGAHACHVGPAQVYRLYGEPVCRPATGEGKVAVRYPYRLRYRQAAELKALFRLPWEDLPGGALEVEFERREGSWRAGAQRELLDPDRGGDE